MERFDLIDKNRMPLGKSIERNNKEQIIDSGCYRQVVHIAVFNSNDELLIQQRQPFKYPHPNKWDISVGGSVISGETPCEAASRELFEEIGLKHDFSNERPSFTINFSSGFDDFFIITQDVSLDELTLQKEEVQAVKWAKLDEILSLIHEEKFIGYFESILKLLFEKQSGSSGSIKKW